MANSKQKMRAIRHIVMSEVVDSHPPPEGMVRVNILVWPHMRKEWKSFALQADTTVTDMVIEAVTQHMARSRP